MVRIILYEEACEVLDLQSVFRDDVEIVAYIKNSNDYYGDFINDIRVYSIHGIGESLGVIEFDYIVVNSRYSHVFYEKLKTCEVNPECILDVSWFNDDCVKDDFRKRLLYCSDNDFLDFDIVFMGRNNIKDKFLSKYFDDYLNVSNRFLDIHYTYHLLYYLVRNNKILNRTKVGMFISYSMIYENINLMDNRRDFVRVFEDIFNIHNMCDLSSTYYDVCRNSFRNNFGKVFRLSSENSINYIDEFKISNFDVEKIKYDAQIETINYNDSNMVAFKMNKNIIAQMLGVLYDRGISTFFIIPPVHEEYRTYINNTLKKEFYSVINRYLNDKCLILDYFNMDFDAKFFSSPTNLNSDGCEEFLRVLSCDVKKKYCYNESYGYL